MRGRRSYHESGQMGDDVFAFPPHQTPEQVLPPECQQDIGTLSF